MSLHPDKLNDEYGGRGFHEDDADADPIRQFGLWFEEASSTGIEMPEAMTLATCDSGGKPSARVVLLKEYDGRGFVFFTNYESRKSRELEENPFAALVFWWPPLERQVRIEGRIEKIATVDSDAYFATRPRGSQIGAWASYQSSVIPDRETLEEQVRDVESKFDGDSIPRPPFWGGWRVIAESIEFWQGRQSRLHDRLRYRREGEKWVMDRLSP